MSETVHTIAIFLEHADTRGGKFERVEFRSVFSLTPMQFLSFAKEDLKTSLRHKYINTLSNAKRAVDCHVDILLQAFGYYETAKRWNWRFPAKQGKIYEMGIAAPQILNKLMLRIFIPILSGLWLREFLHSTPCHPCCIHQHKGL